MFVEYGGGGPVVETGSVVPPPSGADPVQISNGTLLLNTTDFEADGFGAPWGVSRSWGNDPGFAVNDHVGNGWNINQQPQLFLYQPTTSLDVYEVVNSASTAYWFEGSGGADTTAWFNTQDTLSYDGDDDMYTLTDTKGDVTTFNGFDSTHTHYAGSFASYQPASGDLISVTSYVASGPAEYAIREERRQETVDGAVTIESYVYSYNTDGNLSNVLLRRSGDDGSTWQAVRQVSYAYYGSGSSFGDPGDLETATEEDGSGNPLSTDYYRYNISSGLDALQFEFTGPNFARLEQSLGMAGAFNDSNTTVAPYATLDIGYGSYAYVFGTLPPSLDWDVYYEFPQVTSEVVAGLGSTDTGGTGLGTYTFTYADTPNLGSLITTFDPAADYPTQYNTPVHITTETLPDGLVDTYYTNYAAEIDFTIEASSTGTRYYYNQYDGYANPALCAQPEAVYSYSCDSSTGDFSVALYPSAGEITTYTYYSADDVDSNPATQTNAGAVFEYLEASYVQNGSSGTPQELSFVDYKAAPDGNIYYIADSIVYSGINGSGGETTSFVNSYYPGTLSVSTTTTTLPYVDAGQNGPAAYKYDTQVYDYDGNLIWEQDPNGYVTYNAYNIATGAIAETINDVTADDAPSGPPVDMPAWTLSGDELYLITTYQSDAEARTTVETTPDGNTTYTVYDDINHETRMYPGWHQDSSGLFTTTGPVQVELDDWADGYSESFTYAYTPASGVLTPDGSDTISSLQTLTRDITNTSGQLFEEDNYFNLSGVAYNTSFGTLDTNYYATLFAYDSGGRLDRTQTSNGTITRTVYDDLGEPASTWIGTDDSPSSGPWSPANNSSPSNMVEVSANLYDIDGNELQTVQYPGGAAAPRATVFYYDYRDRLIGEMNGAALLDGDPVIDTSDNDTFLTEYVLDNLGDVTATNVYNIVPDTISGGGGIEEYAEPDDIGIVGTPELVAASTASYDDQGRML